MELSEQLASFEKSIEAFQTAVGGPKTAQTSTAQTSDVPLNTKQISQQSTSLPTQFQKIIVALSETQLAPTVGQQMSTYQTEAHRRIRLIGIEAMRLRTAKQPASISRSQQQLNTHVTQLQQFVQAMQAALDGQKG